MSNATDDRAAMLASELRVLLGKLKRRLREQGSAGDLTPSQVAAVVRLEREGPLTVTRLAHFEGVRPQSMGVTVATLEAAGLVGGAADPADGRQTLLSLTPRCRAMLETGRAAREDWLSRAVRANLSSEEQDALAAALELLKRLADS